MKETIEIYNEQKEFFLSFIIAKHGWRIKYDIDDLLQELYIQLDYSKNKFDESRGNFKTYLFFNIFPTIEEKYFEKKSGITKYYRKKGIRKLSEEYINIVDLITNEDETNFEQEFKSELIKSHMRALLTKLEYDIIMQRIAGYKLAEIANKATKKYKKQYSYQLIDYNYSNALKKLKINRDEL